MHRTFQTPGPASVYVEIGSGNVDVHAEPVTQTDVQVEGRDAEDVTVEQRGDQVVVLGPARRLGFGGSAELRVRITLPTDSRLATKLGSADLAVAGRLGSSRLRSGSGDVRVEQLGGETEVETGSGDVAVDLAGADLRVRTGSGDVEVGRVEAEASVVTGSGDVQLGEALGEVQVKSGSGDVRVRDASAGLAMSTASGDLAVGRFQRGSLRVKNVSGDIRVGVPGGVPVWTDISCLTGSVRSGLAGAGQPAPGQDYIELRAKTVSGDIDLEQL